jgi:hypothetical protein
MRRIIICANCKQDKPSKGRGLCYPCYNRKYYSENKETIIEQAKEYRQKHGQIISEKLKQKYTENLGWRIRKKEYCKKYQKEHREKKRQYMREYTKRPVFKLWRSNPEALRRHYARLKAQKEIDVSKEICVICGGHEHLQRHHDDYSKPLDVQILCHDCHKKKREILVCV